MASLQPVNVFKHQAEEEKGETARLSSFIGAVAIGDLVKSTLGPKGMNHKQPQLISTYELPLKIDGAGRADNPDIQ